MVLAALPIQSRRLCPAGALGGVLVSFLIICSPLLFEFLRNEGRASFLRPATDLLHQHSKGEPNA
jgi:hypothetical protein